MISKYKNIIASLIIIIIFAVGYKVLRLDKNTTVPLDSTPQNVTLSGAYVCLPHLDTSGPQTEECAFGLKTDDGVYYAVNFGESQSAMADFQSKKHITAEGFVVIKEALSSDQWAKYNMKGIFTITKMLESQNSNSPIFTWEYDKADSLNLDGQPKTNIYLQVKYPNGEVERKLIDTTPGSCNDLPDADKDSVPHSTNIQCYSAGLGYRFKITNGPKSYLVLRKTFEEALPGHTSSSYKYEVVSEFPLH